MQTIIPIKRALISVSDKKNIIEFAHFLTQLNIEILSTGGTAHLLQEAQIPVTEVSHYTDFPEMMEGRVKTLHPKIHGGILGRRGIDDSVMQQHDIAPIDLVVVNLYPFQQVVAQENCALETAIKNIDVGGPTMVRAAAKNYASITVIVDPNDYESVKQVLQMQSGTDVALRFKLAKKAFAHTAQYDSAIANYLTRLDEKNTAQMFPQTLNLNYEKIYDLRYGENPHQAAAFYRDLKTRLGTLANAQLIQGKELSYNNIADADAALECVKQFDSTQAACTIVKHANPCGVAVRNTALEAYQRAFETDPTSSFGGIIAFNQTLTVQTAQFILQQQFVEVIIAPEVEEAAKSILMQKPNVRVLATGYWEQQHSANWDLKRVSGGLLVQTQDDHPIQLDEWKVVTEKRPSPQQLADLAFAWRVVKMVKSNAIVLVKDQATIGIGAGQMSRIDSTRIASIKAQAVKFETQGAVLASDAFFPFADSIETAQSMGITAIVQPGGSMRDAEVIAKANEAGIAMVMTGVRHFRH